MTGTDDPTPAGRAGDHAATAGTDGGDRGDGAAAGTDGAVGVSQLRRPRRLRSAIIGTAIAAVLAVLLFVVLAPSSGPGTGPLVGVGSNAPEFSLPSLSGTGVVDLDALGRDRHRPVVLNFFASWCGPCREETPLLAATSSALASRGSKIQFIGVDVADPHSDAVAFVKQAGIHYPVAVDAELKVAADTYGLNGEPHTFFIESSGRVIGSFSGALHKPQLESWLHRLGGSAG